MKDSAAGALGRAVAKRDKITVVKRDGLTDNVITSNAEQERCVSAEVRGLPRLGIK